MATQGMLFPEATSECRGFLGDGTRVLFYPASGHDWNPLYRLTHLVDTFVYCDWRYSAEMAAETFEEDIQNIHTATPAGESLRCESIESLDREMTRFGIQVDPGFLTQVERRRYQERIDGWEIDTTGWGRLVHLTRRIGTKERKIKLYYFGTEGVATYLRLFAEQCVVPRVVCIVSPSGSNWADLRSDNPVGTERPSDRGSGSPLGDLRTGADRACGRVPTRFRGRG